MRKAALIAVAATVAFLVVMDWVPTPLNRNIAVSTPAERLPGTLIHGLVGIGVCASLLLGRRRPIFAGAIWYSAVLVSALANWWMPYLLGIYPGEIRPATYQREYGDNLTVLPPILDHPVIPDLQHSLLHLGLLLSCLLCWAAFRRTPLRRTPGDSGIGVVHDHPGRHQGVGHDHDTQRADRSRIDSAR